MQLPNDSFARQVAGSRSAVEAFVEKASSAGALRARRVLATSSKVPFLAGSRIIFTLFAA